MVKLKEGYTVSSVKHNCNETAIDNSKYVITVAETNNITVSYSNQADLEYTCQSVCDECGKCTNADCAESVCADKCEGHGSGNNSIGIITGAVAAVSVGVL